MCLRSKKRDVKDVVKNAGNFLAKNVQKGFMEGTEKLRKLADHDFNRESVVRKGGCFLCSSPLFPFQLTSSFLFPLFLSSFSFPFLFRFEDPNLAAGPGMTTATAPPKQLFGFSLEVGLKVGHNEYDIPLIVESCLQYVEQNRKRR